MKKQITLGLFVLCFMVCGIFSDVFAQGTGPYRQQTKFGIKSLGIHVEWYKPSLAYWNDTYLADNNWAESFTASNNYGVFLDFNINNNMRLRTGFSSWSQSVRSGSALLGTLEQNKILQISLTSAQVDVVFQPVMKSEIKPYAGVGGRFVMIQDKITRQITGLSDVVETTQSQTYTGHVIVGIERHLFDLFSGAVEGGYVLGKYQKYFKNATTNDFEIQDLSLTGPMVRLKFLYDF